MTAAARQEWIAAQLSDIVGNSGLVMASEGLGRYCRDWSGDIVGIPLLVVRPRGVEQVSRIVAFCAANELKLVPQGGHTGLVGGGTPTDRGDEIILSLELMNEIGALDEHNFSLEVQAGCILENVRAHVADRGFVFPLALGSQGSCQIGGAIATNAGGLNVLRYGMMRELVLGLEVVLPDGRIWNGLKALRKDNTGYDFKQVILGSEGTLGVVTAATLKLFPQPTQIETAFVSLHSLEAVIDLYGLARRRLSDLLSAFELLTQEGVEISGQANPLGEPAPIYVLIEVSASGPVDVRSLLESFLEESMGSGLIADAALATSTAQAASFWKIREEVIEAQLRRGRHLRTDVSMPISAIPAFIRIAGDVIGKISSDAIVLAYGHVGDGNLHFNVVPPAYLDEGAKVAFLHECEEAIFAVVDELDGSISAEHGIGRLKREAFLKRISPVHADLLQALRTAFDPAGTLSPGRMLKEMPR
ncbi:FAD-binding oxidoreductase [Aminobacter sp. Piv2-1]|uniref:FAD-binding oxidoreductase n=1 Tax=Aminobacter sp. Piv2-1 TaxID=3031122 RepID=UPI00309A862E